MTINIKNLSLLLIAGTLLFQVFSQAGCSPKKDHVAELLEKLDLMKDFNQDGSYNGKEGNHAMENYQLARKELKEMGTNSFPFLIKELNSFTYDLDSFIYDPNREKNREAWEKKCAKYRQLTTAFSILGTNLTSMLLPEFESCLYTNKNYGCALSGISTLGEPATRYLLDILSTNNSSDIRSVAACELSNLGVTLNIRDKIVVDPKLGEAITEKLIPYLKSPNAFVRVRVASGIAIYCQDAKSAIQPMLECLKDEKNEEVLVEIIKWTSYIQDYFEEYDPQVDIVVKEIGERQYESEAKTRWIKKLCTDLLERKAKSPRKKSESHSNNEESIK